MGPETTFLGAILFRNLILLLVLQLAFEHQWVPILTLIVSLSWSLIYWTGNLPPISCISLRQLQSISYKIGTGSKDIFDDTIISIFNKLLHKNYQMRICCTVYICIYAYMCFLYMGTLHNQLEIFDIWSFSLASDGVKYLTFCCKTSVIVYKL